MGRIQRAGIWIAVLIFALLCAGETFSGVRGTIRRGGHRQGVADHVVAYAALETLESGTGWGRFVDRDDMLPSGYHRFIKVWLFDLQPDSEYLVEADGVEVGTVMTDHRGAARLKLTTQGQGHDPVPFDLPPASELVEALVIDGSGVVVLEGAFRIIREQVSDPAVYCEKIRLDDVNGGDARGYAGVVRKMSGAQLFATMATGLVPGRTYRIVIDGAEVAIVVADGEGQAGVELHAPADEHVLPEELMPVDEILEVRWFDGEAPLLAGFFTGESDCEARCDEFEGVFAGLTDSGFILRKGDREVEIVVTDDTEFEGFDDLSQLVEGDWLEVKACTDGDQLFARSVELEEPERECWEKHGTFVELTENGFVLRVGGPDTGADTEIVVTDETEFEGFEYLADLEEGDWLEVEACWDGEHLIARSVELEEPERECDELLGNVISRTDHGFVLGLGDESVEVVVTDDTELKGFDSLDELDGGEVVVLEGCFDGEVLVAAWVKLLVDDDCVELGGVVAERTDHGFVLQVGDDFVEVAVTDETELKGFDSLDELQVGYEVGLEGCFDGEVLVAAWVCLFENNDCAELHGTVAERMDLGFVLQVGDDFVEVAVTDETVFKNFDSLADLDVGDAVALEGCFEGDVLVAAWVRLLEDDDCAELHGVVAERTDLGFVLQVGDDFVEVAVTDETELKGFDSLDDLDVGDTVALAGCFDGDVLVAAWVQLLEGGGGLEWWVADGTVVGLLEDGFEFEADGEVVIVIITEETVLEGYESAEQIAVDDVVLVEGLSDGEKVFAERVVRGDK